MPKQSDDLIRERDESEETEKAGLKIPVPQRRSLGNLAEPVEAQKNPYGERLSKFWKWAGSLPG